jgi:short chain dehydrogenase
MVVWAFELLISFDSNAQQLSHVDNGRHGVNRRFRRGSQSLQTCGVSPSPTHPCAPRAARSSPARLTTTNPSIYPTIDPKVHHEAQTFAGKVVLITGASRGIGAGIALQYALAGANLTLVARSQAELDATRNMILREHLTAQILIFPADVRDVAGAQEAVATTVAHFGRLDILVTNAGTIRPADKRALSCPLCHITTTHPTTESCRP